MNTKTDSSTQELSETATQTPQLDSDEGNQKSSVEISSVDGLKAALVAQQESLKTALADLGEHKKSVSDGFTALREQFAALLARHEELKSELKKLQTPSAENTDSAEVPLASPAAEAPVATPAAEAPVATRTAEVPIPSPAEPPATHFGDAAVPELQQSDSDEDVQPFPVVAPQDEDTVVYRRPAIGLDFERDIFGEVLADDSSIAADRTQLVAGLTNGDEAATALLGHLLIFRSSSLEQIPKQLSEVGEAFYRWQYDQGREKDAFRDALIDWLGERCQETGLNNRIDLVRVGDRFEPSRHNSKQRGVEVSKVLGWVVLRDNGKVYTRASVEAK